MKKNNLLIALLFPVCSIRTDAGSQPSSASKPATNAAKASQVKEAFINVPLIFEQSTMGKNLHEEMVSEARRFQQEIEEKRRKIDLAKKELSNKATAMSADAIRQEEKKIAQLERDLDAQIKEKEEDFQMMAAKKEQAWAQEFQTVVADWAREEFFDKVCDEVTGRPLYVDAKLKRTDEVIVRMNKRSADKESISLSGEKSKSSAAKKV